MFIIYHIGIFVFNVILFTALFLFFGYNTSAWKGLLKSRDDTFMKKFHHRLYFVVLTYATVGLGGIVPHAYSTRILTGILSIIIFLHTLLIAYTSNDWILPNIIKKFTK